MPEYNILDLSSSQMWNEFLHKLPIEQQDIYYTPEYYQLYEKLGDGKATCFVYENEGGIALYPFLLNSVNGLGFDLDNEYYDIQGAYGYNGIISNSYEDSFISSFFTAFNDYIRINNIIAEFTRFHPLLKNYKFSEGNMNVFFDRKTIFINLKNKYEVIFNSFQKTTRKQIKRCFHKYNLEVDIIENDVSHIDTFYSIYKEAMVRVNATKYLHFDIEYFSDLILNTKSALFIAKYKGTPISSIIVFYDEFYMHGHLGGAVTDYLFTSSFSLLYSEIIRFGIEKKCQIFHVGGGNTSSENDRLLQYKKHFSQSTGDFYIGKKIHNPTIYNEVVKLSGEKKPKKSEIFTNYLLNYRY